MELKRLNCHTEIFLWRFFVHSILVTIPITPEPVLRAFAQLTGRVAFSLSGKRRKLAVSNLASAFKHEKSPLEITTIARQVFCEIALNTVDAAIFFLKKPDINRALSEYISVEGTEYMDEALKAGKGVICVSAHFGNFMIMSLRLSLMGYPCNTILKDRINPVVSEIWQDLRRKVGINWIPARPRIRAVSGSLKWLKKGGILFLYADQHKKDGVDVTFFNRPAGTVEGPAMFHLRTGAPLLCAFIVRTGDKNYKIVITPPIDIQQSGDRDADVHAVTQAYTAVIEAFIRKYPEQWWWPHKRWAKNIPSLSDPEDIL